MSVTSEAGTQSIALEPGARSDCRRQTQKKPAFRAIADRRLAPLMRALENELAQPGPAERNPGPIRWTAGADALGADRDVHAPADLPRARRRNLPERSFDGNAAVNGRADAALHEICLAHEGGGEQARGLPVDALGRPDVLDAALVEQQDRVGDRHRFFLIVRDMDERRAQRALKLAQLVLHLPADLDVQRTKRLVEQEDGRLDDDSARERDTLALAAGDLVNFSVAEARRDRRPQALLRPARIRSRSGTRRIDSPNAVFCRTFMCGKSA